MKEDQKQITSLAYIFQVFAGNFTTHFSENVSTARTCSLVNEDISFRPTT